MLTPHFAFCPSLCTEQYDNKGSDVATSKHRAGEDFQALMGQAKDLTNGVDMKFSTLFSLAVSPTCQSISLSLSTCPD